MLAPQETVAHGPHRLPNGWLRFPLKEVLLAAYLLPQLPWAVQRVVSLGRTPGLFTHAILHAALLATLLVLLIATGYIRSTVLRWVFATLMAAGALCLKGYERIAEVAFSYEAFLNLWDAAAFADAAFTQHAGRLLNPVATSILLAIAIGITPRRRPFPILVPPLAPWGGTALLSATLYLMGGEGAQGLPAAFVTLSYSTLYLTELATDEVGPRQPIVVRRTMSGPGGDVVLIVDESISATYLDINSPRGVPSGLDRLPSGVTVSNFGIAASIANCSAATNNTLRFGGTRTDYQRINRTQPSIWAYAKRAQLRTVYIDAQRSGGRLQNGMTNEERREIDDFIQFDTVAFQQRDMAAARELARHLNDRVPEFIMVNKVGAHFPIADKYPVTYARYGPALPRDTGLQVSDMGMPDTLKASVNWRLYRNAYRNTVAWNVGGFFRYLLTAADMSRATVFYTSDHGQNLREHGGRGAGTHCSEVPAIEEGAVPLVILSDGQTARWRWDHLAARHRDRASHYQLFPTLLLLMGYDQDEVRSRYGASLADTLPDEHSFNARFNARLGKQPVWISFAASQVAHPPSSDLETDVSSR